VSNGECFALSSIKIPKTGKWYVELQMPSNGIFGITKEYITSSGDTGKIFLGINEDGIKYQNGSNTQLGSEKGMGGGSEVAGLLIDPEAETKNLRWFYSGNEVHFEDYDLKSDDFFVLLGKYSGGNNIINFGQDHTFDNRKTDSSGNAPHGTAAGTPGLFYYQPPEGAKALCSANLPSFDENPQEHFRAVTYVGSGTDNHKIEVGFEPDLVWIKDRVGGSHVLVDSVRGVDKELFSNKTDQQQTHSGTESNTDRVAIRSFDNDGFTLSEGVGSTGTSNWSGQNTVSWSWKAGGGGGKYNIDGVPYLDFANTGLTAGTIEPIGMSVNTKAGFSIVKYQGAGTSNPSTIPHGLNKSLDFYIVKSIDESRSWEAWHNEFTVSDYIQINSPSEKLTYADAWGSVPTNSTFGVGNSNNANVQNENYIAYCWHSVPGHSAFGSYNGNGSADGPFVYTGFKPAFVMIKNTTNSNSWVIIDNQRSPFNPSHQAIRADSSGEEITNQETNFGIDVLSNGFKPKTSGNENVNSNNAPSNKYIYMAFAEHSM
jgi:hypothetical protein